MLLLMKLTRKCHCKKFIAPVPSILEDYLHNLAERDRRLSVLPSFPCSARALAFYAVLELPAAVRAFCRDGLDLGVLHPVTIFALPYRCPASGFGLYSSVGKPSLDRGFCNLARGMQISANMCETAFLHTVRKREVFPSRDCLLCVVENGTERIANFLWSREIRHLQSQSETPCRWMHSRWSCSSAAWAIWKLEIQIMQFVKWNILHESAEHAKYFSVLLDGHHARYL